MYTVDYFIKKFEAIPESKWCINQLINTSGQRCALGHCGGVNLKIGEIPYNDEIGNLVITLYDVVSINNGENPEYQQPTPKQRILAALYDIKKQNQGTEPSTERRNEVQSELQRADIRKKLSQIETVPETSDLKKELV